jgi:8-oxo-dGTP pyrophosphatase MutT (NUDIX family)
MSSQASWTADALRQRAQDRLLPTPGDAVFDPRTGRSLGRSDWDLNPEFVSDLAAMPPPRPAAVLVPIVARAELTVLFTLRTNTLSNHAGQIAFPGGRADPEDTSAVATAMREAREEIGLDPHLIEPIGFLDGYRTGTGFHITPVVALVRPDFTLTLAQAEVAAAFEVPLAFLMDATNHQREEREWRGRQRAFYAITYDQRYIWGATAGMIKNLHERLVA